MRLKRGFLVAFEGIDGAGKSTQARLLYEHLQSRGLDVVLSKEPTDSSYGRQIRKLAQGDRALTTPREEYDLFVNDRRIHVAELIKPALAQGKIVILDRYYFSSMAYQGVLGLDVARIREENESFAPVPDVVFLLRVAPSLGRRRIQVSRNETPDLFEKEESLTKVGQVFDSLEDRYIVRINGSDDQNQVHARITKIVDDVVDHYLTSEDRHVFSPSSQTPQ